MASLIRTLDRLPFERPLAAALGASAAFATLAAPIGPADALAGGRIAVAVLAALASALVAWAAMRRPRRGAPAAACEPVEPFEMDEADDAPPVRMRRADRHPDAPFRQPIRASRDLGTPFMAVGGNEAAVPEFAEYEDVPANDTAPAIVAIEGPAATVPAPDAPAVIEPAAGADAEPPAIAPAVAPVPAPAGLPDRAVTVAVSDADAAPATPAAEMPAAAPRESLSTLMERLARGAERRGGVPPRRSPAAIARTADQVRDIQPGLRDALATLNRLAERR